MVLVQQVRHDNTAIKAIKGLKADLVHFAFGGGIGAFGTNFSIFTFQNETVWVDAGAGFANHHTPGLEKTLPNAGLLSGFKPDCIVLTHGHEDHIGAMPFIYDLIPEGTPVLLSSFTMELVRHKYSEFKLDLEKFHFKIIEMNSHHELNHWRLDFFYMPHSIPQAFSVGLQTKTSPPARPLKLYFTSDFKTLGNEKKHDPEKIKNYAPVDVLFCDSTGAMSTGEAEAEGIISRNMEKALKAWPGRIFITTFSSHVERIRSIFKIAEKLGRPVGVFGYSIKSSLKAAFHAGIFDIPPERIKDPAFSNERAIWIIAGCQADTGSSFNRLAADGLGRFKLNQNDLVVYSSSIIPGNQAIVYESLNRLTEKGVTVKGLDQGHGLHASGHGKQDDIKKLINWLQPASVIPVHGDALHFKAFENIRDDMNADFMIHSPLAATIYTIDRGNIEEAARLKNQLTLVEPGEIHHDFNLYRVRTEISQQGIANIVVHEKDRGLADLSLVGVSTEDFLTEKMPVLIEEITSHLKNHLNVHSKNSQKKSRVKIQSILFQHLRKKPYVNLVII